MNSITNAAINAILSLIAKIEKSLSDKSNTTHTHDALVALKLTNQNLDDIKPNNITFYYANLGHSVKNSPFSNGSPFVMCVYGSESNYKIQEIMSMDGNRRVRYTYSSTWQPWVRVPIFLGNIENGEVLITSGGLGAIRSSGYTLEASVPKNAVFTDTVYTHPTTPGNKHIPSGGSAGQILRWEADGTAVWGDITISISVQVVMSPDGWVSQSGVYVYEISNSNITASNNVVIVPKYPISITNLKKLDITNITQSAGKLTLTSSTKPDANIAITMYIYKEG